MLIRLHEPAFIDNHRYNAGDVVRLKPGVKGPHRTIRMSADTIDYDPANGIDANHVPPKMKDVPLFEIVEEDKKEP